MRTDLDPSHLSSTSSTTGRTRGRMTAMMHAARLADGPRVLRIALVSAGRIVAERAIERRERVTVGSREDCTFVLPEPADRRLAVFEPSAGGWELCVTAGMRGRVAMDGALVQLEQLRDTPRLRLTETARGRVTVGDATLLFQLVPQAPAAPRPQLPLSVKQGLVAQIDWPLTVLVALSFLFHFGLVGGMYSDWADPAVDTDVTARLVMPPSVAPPPPVETQDGPTASAQPTADSSTSSPVKPAPTVRPVPPSPAPPSPNDVAALLHEWSDLRVATIGQVGLGPNARRVLSTTDDPAPVNLNDLANKPGAVVNDPLALNLPHASDPIHPTDDPLLTLQPHETAPVTSTAGTVTPVVPFQLRQEPVQTSVTMTGVEAVVRRQLQPRARQCYQHAVNADPSLPDGNVVVTMRVSPSGEVTSATVSRTGLSSGVGSCIQGAASRLTFDAPGPAGATVTVPMHFVKQGGR
jgi:hypothetical protein